MMSLLFFIGTIVIDLWLSSWIDFAFLGINFIFVPATSLLFLVYIQPNYSKRQIITTAIILGIFFDLLMFTPLFTHSIAFTITLVLVIFWRNQIGDSNFELFVIGLLAIFVKESVIFLLANILNLNGFNIINWYVLRVFPTLLVNSFAILMAIKISNLYVKTEKQKQNSLVKKESSRWFLTNKTN